MKTFRIRSNPAAILGGLCLISANLVPPAAVAQGALPYLEQAMSRVIVAAQLMNLVDYTHAPANNFLGAFMASGTGRRLNTWVEAGKRYLVIAAGDQDVMDVDLAVLTSSGSLVAKDNDDQPVAVVEFTVHESAWLVLELQNYFSLGPGFCSMVILEQVPHGDGFALTDLTEALGNALASARSMGVLGTTRFVESDFCVFGGRLAQGGESSLYNYALPAGRYLAVSAGSGRVTDVDLTVVAQNRLGDSEGTVIVRDNRADPTPVCEFTANGNQFYAVTQKNYATREGGNGFIFTCLLRR